MNYQNLDKETILRKILTPEARERLGRIRIVKPLKVEEIVNYLIQLYLAGRITPPITDEKLKQILSLLSKKREFRIIKK